MGQVLGQLEVGVGRGDRAGVGAGAAVDALVGVDIEHLGVAEAGLVGRGVDTADRTLVDAGGVIAARLRDHVGHGGSGGNSGGHHEGQRTLTQLLRSTLP